MIQCLTFIMNFCRGIRKREKILNIHYFKDILKYLIFRLHCSKWRYMNNKQKNIHCVVTTKLNINYMLEKRCSKPNSFLECFYISSFFSVKTCYLTLMRDSIYSIFKHPKNGIILKLYSDNALKNFSSHLLHKNAVI